jgi:OsmC-like protein
MWLLGLIISLLLSGCSLLSMEEPALVSTVSDAQSDDEGHKNLAAVRAMVAEERQRSSLTAGSSDTRSPEPAPLSWPPDWLSSYFLPKRLSRMERETDSFSYESYNRDHVVIFEGGVRVPASAAPAYRGNASHVNPEEALVAALSSCHMLTFLAAAAKKQFVVERYLTFYNQKRPHRTLDGHTADGVYFVNLPALPTTA